MASRTLSRFSPRRVLRDLPIPRKLTLIIALFCIVIFKLLVLSWFGLEILSGSRAYVAGEGMWSKAQKGATYRLARYALFHDEADYRAYREHIAVSHGDRTARVELSGARVDPEKVDQGFIQGGNHPDDVAIMSYMARHFDQWPYMREAMDLWQQADKYLDDLERVAAQLRAEMSSGSPSDARIKALMMEVNVIDQHLTQIENDFSATLGEGARWLKRILLITMISATALFLALVLTIAFFISRHLCREIDQLRAGAARIAGGDYSITLNVAARDEVGDLARSFQEMATQRQHAERLKDEFFANVSHELRTPLTLILSPLESLLAGDYGPVDRTLEPALLTMHNNTVRLLQLVNGLLDFSKLQAGQLHVNREAVRIADITEAVYTDFKPLFAQHASQATLTMDCPAHAVMLDRYLYERIFFNLLSNAVKFTPSQGCINITVQWSQDQLTLAVSDTGIGIPAEQTKTIFERFHQVEGSSTRRFEGTGLGLALVKEFAGLMEGDVSVNSMPGRGSTFTVTCSAPASELAAVGSVHTASVHPAFFNSAVPPQLALQGPSMPERATVLVAEDNIEMASYIASLLQPLATVKIARDGDAALRLLAEESADLILTDVMMPKRDGIDLCREVKAQAATAQIPVVMLTALTHREALLEGWKAGADEYLFKPFHPRELLTRVQSLLNAHRAKKAADERIAALNRELTQHASDLESANEELKTFSYSVSHDLRNPLRVIAGFSDILLESHASTLDPKGHHLLEQVREYSQDMGQKINALLNLASTARAELERVPVDLSRVARSVAEELRQREPGRSVAFEIQDGLEALTDMGLMRILLDNLLGNAWKFTSRQTAPKLTFSGEEKDGQMVFAVGDNGAGFNMNYARKLFVPFQRLHRKEEFTGSGIGLATVRRIVDRHGGKIWAQAEIGKGATFYFTLG